MLIVQIILTVSHTVDLMNVILESFTYYELYQLDTGGCTRSDTACIMCPDIVLASCIY